MTRTRWYILYPKARLWVPKRHINGAFCSQAANGPMTPHFGRPGRLVALGVAVPRLRTCTYTCTGRREIAARGIHGVGVRVLASSSPGRHCSRRCMALGSTRVSSNIGVVVQTRARTRRRWPVVSHKGKGKPTSAQHYSPWPENFLICEYRCAVPRTHFPGRDGHETWSRPQGCLKGQFWALG